MVRRLREAGHWVKRNVYAADASHGLAGNGSWPSTAEPAPQNPVIPTCCAVSRSSGSNQVWSCDITYVQCRTVLSTCSPSLTGTAVSFWPGNSRRRWTLPSAWKDWRKPLPMQARDIQYRSGSQFTSLDFHGAGAGVGAALSDDVRPAPWTTFLSNAFGGRSNTKTSI